MNGNCSGVLLNNVHEVRKAVIGQFPYVVALISPEDEYVCAGSIVADRLILTTAECADTAKYVLINTTSAKRGKTSVNNILLNITQKEKFPTNDKNVALLYVEKSNSSFQLSKILVSNFTRPEEVKSAKAIGFGLNTETGQTKKLQYVGLYVRNAGDTSNAFIKCIYTTVPSCFKDKGGPVIYNDELVGVVTEGARECALEITSHYDIDKHMLNFINAYVFKAWLDDKINKKNETLDSDETVISRRRFTPVGTGRALMIKISPAILIHILFII
ncbi:trypsin-like [Aricia agestis]|uniref:trypsin-like n=1 Tax=Aricia agestis TaxID=91739 RepID=UPI001C20909E|nr:trypsin-like [Aricia agestis]